MSPADLQLHTDAMWRLCFEYAKANGIESSTTGILILSEFSTDPTKIPATCLNYASDPKQAAITMARCAAAELQKTGVTLGGGS